MTTEYTPAADLPARKGTWAWVIALLTLVVPGVGAVIGVIVEVFAYHFYNKQRDVGAVNARNASNLVISYAIITVACAIVFFAAPVVGALFASFQLIFYLLGLLALGVWALVSLLVVVFAILGIVAAVQRRSFDPGYVWRVVKGDRVWEV
ncbi:MAG TPA: hypothetical protein VGC45_03075 [Gryllotalpicola sp.]